MVKRALRLYLTVMNPDKNSSLASSSAPQGVKAHRLIKLGVDVHLREYVVARQIDGLAPQSAQKFSPEAFVAWAAKQVQQADVVHCCYEAGPFGFGLHRRLERLGIKNIVVRPRNWDEYGKKSRAKLTCFTIYLIDRAERFSADSSPWPANSDSNSPALSRACPKNRVFENG